MISKKKNFLFIHVPKTGGNSIQNILKKYSDDRIVALTKYQDGYNRFEVRNDKYDITKHSTLNCYKREIEYNTFKQLFKFSTIRNPWDMCISFYFSPHRGKIDWNRNEFKEFILTIPTIRHYITLESKNDINSREFNGNNKSRARPIDADLDFILRFENLNKDFQKVCEIINVPFEELPHLNNSSRSHYTKYYDDELVEFVRCKFSDEINYANYTYGE